MGKIFLPLNFYVREIGEICMNNKKFNQILFDGIETVAFLVNGKELYDFTLEDVSWSERIFSFEGDF